MQLQAGVSGSQSSGHSASVKISARLPRCALLQGAAEQIALLLLRVKWDPQDSVGAELGLLHRSGGLDSARLPSEPTANP